MRSQPEKQRMKGNHENTRKKQGTLHWYQNKFFKDWKQYWREGSTYQKGTLLDLPGRSKNSKFLPLIKDAFKSLKPNLHRS